jgi:WG repeat protein
MPHKRSTHVRTQYKLTGILLIAVIISTTRYTYAQTQLDQASLYKNGFARVVKDNKYWYLDTAGHYAFDKIAPVPDNYNYTGANANPLNIVTRQQKLGVLKNGQWILNPAYDSIDTQFNVWKISKDGMTTWCDTSGQLLAPLRFYGMGYLDGHHFDVQQNGKWGIYDNRKDSVIIPFLYDEFDYCGGCGLPSDYVLAKKNGKWGVVSFRNEVLVPFEYDHQHMNMRSDEWVMSLQHDDHFTLINMQTGKIFAEPEYTFSGSNLWGDLVCLAKKGKYGLQDKYGRQIVDFMYDDISWFDDMAERKDYYASVEKNGKYGLIDTTGKIVIPIIYSGMIWAYNDSTFYMNGAHMKMLLDHHGHHLLPEYYKEISELRPEGQPPFLFTVTKNGKQGIYNRITRTLTPIVYDALSAYDITNCIVTERNKKKGLLNSQGKQILPPVFDQIDAFYDYANLIQVKTGDQEGLYDSSGNLILPPKYDFIFRDYTDTGLLHIKVYTPKGGQEGIATTNGKILVPPRYDDIKEITIQSFLLHKDDHYFLFDSRTGEKDSLTPKEASREFTGISAAPFQKGIALSQKEKIGYGFIDSTGKEIIPPVYDLIWQEEGGNGFIVRQNGKYGVFNTEGKIIIPPIYENILTENINIYTNKTNFTFPLLCNKDNQWQYITANGSILPYQAKEITTFDAAADPPAEDADKPADGIKTTSPDAKPVIVQ